MTQRGTRCAEVIIGSFLPIRPAVSLSDSTSTMVWFRMNDAAFRPANSQRASADDLGILVIIHGLK
jgi:hypothetical protein